MSERGTNIRARISDEYEKTAGYLTYDMTEACGQEMDIMDDEIDAVAVKLDASKLTGDELTRFVLQHKGISRKIATYATGTVTVTGTGSIAVGDLFETDNGVQFSATSAVTVTDTADVPVQAVIAGNTGVVGSGTIVQFPVTLSGIVTVTNASATTGGYDAETDADLYARYLVALQTPASSGNKYDYKNWALEVTGVGDAQVYPLGHGDNTVDVVIINTAKQPADTTLVASVQAHIDPSSEGKGEGTAPIGAHCYVSSATATNINIGVKLTLKVGADETTVKAAVEANIASYLKSIAFTGSAVSYAQIGNQIIDTEGVLDYESLTVNGGTANIAISDRYVAVLGTVTYA